MSSVANSSSPSSSTAPGSASGVPRGAATEAVRKSLHDHLRKTAGFIRILDLLVKAFTFLACGLVVWLVACVIDHWLVPLTPWMRWSIWIGCVAATIWFVVFQVAPLLLRRINLTYAAQRIEHVVPEFKNGLISWLELEQLPEQGVPRGVMAALAYRAKRYIGDQDPSATVDTSPLIKLLGCVLILSVAMVGYAIASSKSVGVTGKRILMPWLSLNAPTRVEIMKVSPGSTELTQGQPLTLDVELRGLSYEEPVFVRYSTLDGQFVNQQQTLDPVTEGFRYGGTVLTGEHGVEQELDYWVEAGDAIQGPFRITLNPLPTLILESAELTYPKYTRLPPQVLDGSAEIEAVEGSKVKLTARSNQTLSKANLEVNPSVNDRGDLIRADAIVEMQLQDRQAAGALLMLLNESGDNPTPMEFRIRGYNERMEGNPDPVIHQASVLADMPPEVTLVGPESRTIKVAPNSLVEVETRVNDPDYGIAKLTLQVRKNSRRLGETTLIEDEGLMGRQVKTAKLDMRRLRPQVGDLFQITATAQDNRHDPRTEKWSPNTAVSEPLLLQVVDPNEATVPPRESLQNPANNPADSTGSNADNSDTKANQSKSGRQDPANNSAGDSNSGDSAQDASASSDPSQGEDSIGENAASNTTEDNQDGAEGDASQPSSGSGQPGSESGDGQSGEQSGSPSGTGQEGSRNSQSSQRTGSSGSNGNDGESNSNSGGDSSEQTGSNSSSTGDSESGNSRASGNPSSPDGNPQTDSNTPGSSGGSRNSQTGNRSDAPLSDREVIERVRDRIRSDDNNRAGEQSTGAQSTDANSQEQSDSPSQSQSSGAPSNSPDTKSPQGADPSENPSSNDRNTPQQNSDSGNQSNSDAGNQSSGNQSSGNQSSGNQSSGSQSSGSQSSGSQSSGSQSSGNQSSGNQSSGSQGSSQSNAGNESQGSNSGGQQGSDSSGESQGGNSNQGDPSSSNPGSQSGSQNQQSNSGSQSSGSQSSGSQSSGSQSSGSQSSGSQSSGSQSSGSQSSGSDSSQSQGAQNSSSSDGAQGSQNSDGSQNSGGSQDEDGSQGQQSQAGGSGGQTSNPNAQGTGDQQGQSSETPGSPTGSGGQSSQAPGGSSSSGSPGNAEGGAPPQGGGRGGPGNGSGSGAAGGAGGDSGTRDAANSEYAEKTTQMVLDYLDRQKDQPDSDLLQDLDWTKEDLQEFVQRWKKARDLGTNGSEQDRTRWKNQLKDLGLQPPRLGTQRGSSVNDSFQQMQDAGSRARVPASWRREFEAFQKALQSQ